MCIGILKGEVKNTKGIHKINSLTSRILNRLSVVFNMWLWTQILSNLLGMQFSGTSKDLHESEAVLLFRLSQWFWHTLKFENPCMRRGPERMSNNMQTNCVQYTSHRVSQGTLGKWLFLLWEAWLVFLFYLVNINSPLVNPVFPLSSLLKLAFCDLIQWATMLGCVQAARVLGSLFHVTGLGHPPWQLLLFIW